MANRLCIINWPSFSYNCPSVLLNILSLPLFPCPSLFCLLALICVVPLLYSDLSFCSPSSTFSACLLFHFSWFICSVRLNLIAFPPHLIHSSDVKEHGKAISVVGRGGQQVYETSRLPDFLNQWFSTVFILVPPDVISHQLYTS